MGWREDTAGLGSVVVELAPKKVAGLISPPLLRVSGLFAQITYQAISADLALVGDVQLATYVGLGSMGILAWIPQWGRKPSRSGNGSAGYCHGLVSPLWI
jgi:hypothetical protein